MATSKTRIRSLEKSEKSFLKSFGRRVTEQAFKKGISIEHLAYEAGVSKGYLYDIVKGNGNPSLVVLLRIADALEISPHQMLKS